MRKNFAVLISDTGTGSNLKTIINAIQEDSLNASIAVVVSDSKDSRGLRAAKINGIKVVHVNKNSDLLYLFKKKFPVDYIVLAGWKLIISDELIDSFPEKIINLHPGLIPDKITGVVKNPDGSEALWNRGKLATKAIAQFLEKKSTYAGSSVHYLTHEFDFGPVLGRVFEKIRPDDTIESLYLRLKVKENKLYLKVLKKLCNN